MTENTQSTEDRTQTQERLLDAALDVFGRHGYDGATTRMIARQAQANIATIPYYFGGKEGLYLAVIDRIVALIASRVSPIRQEVVELLTRGPLAPETAAELFERILSALLTFMVGSPQAPRVARIILREQLDPSSAYDRIFSGFMAPALDVSASLIRTIAPGESERSSRLRAMAIFGQILAFRVARETVVRALQMEGYSESETREIREIVLNHTRAIMAALDSSASGGDAP